MFCTTLRQRHDLLDLLPFLSSSANPKLRESNLRTHDLALALPVTLHPSRGQQPQPKPHPHPHSSNQNHQHHNHHPLKHLFLILTPESTTPANLPNTLTRIANFTALTSTTTTRTTTPTPHPCPTIAFLLPSSPPSQIPLHAYTILQTSIHSLPLPLPTSPPLLLPIPTPQSLLPLLISHLTQPPPSPPAPLPFAPSFLLLRHATITAPARPLPEHPAHVLSDLYPSLRALAAAAGTQAGRERLREWVGVEEAERVVAFWEGEWVV